jgi:hypothetical protein
MIVFGVLYLICLCSALAIFAHSYPKTAEGKVFSWLCAGAFVFGTVLAVAAIA